MPFPSKELDHISSITLEHYNKNAQGFREGTKDHDVSQNINSLLRHINSKAPFTILDVGCGPGRDLKTFSALGHKAIGLDGALEFVEMARAETLCEVWHQDFLKLDLPKEYFDGVFANASLFHIPTQELPRVLKQFHTTLKPGGVLFSSNPRGANEEGWNIITARWVCRVNNNPGWRVCGGKYKLHSNLFSFAKDTYPPLYNILCTIIILY